MASDNIGRTDDAESAPVEDMGVDHGCLEAGCGFEVEMEARQAQDVLETVEELVFC